LNQLFIVNLLYNEGSSFLFLL